jgi:hypothetical protein
MTINLPETIALTRLPQRPHGHSDLDTGHARNGKKLSGLAIKQARKQLQAVLQTVFLARAGIKPYFWTSTIPPK